MIKPTTSNGLYLGGTVNSDWRTAFIKIFNEENIPLRCYNPIVENWTAACIDLEDLVKESSKYHVYVVTPAMRGMYSIAEMCDSAHNSRKKTFFYFKETDVDSDGNTLEWTPQQKNSLTAVANLLIRHGAKCAHSMDELVDLIAIDYRNTPITHDPFEI